MKYNKRSAIEEELLFNSPLMEEIPEDEEALQERLFQEEREKEEREEYLEYVQRDE